MHIFIERWKRARHYEENIENWEDIFLLHEDHRPTILIDTWEFCKDYKEPGIFSDSRYGTSHTNCNKPIHGSGPSEIYSVVQGIEQIVPTAMIRYMVVVLARYTSAI